MIDQSDLEDWRGVDVALIRELLKLTPAQRVERMVNIVNTMQDIQTYAKAAGRDKDVRALPYLRSLKDPSKDVG